MYIEMAVIQIFCFIFFVIVVLSYYLGKRTSLFKQRKQTLITMNRYRDRLYKITKDNNKKEMIIDMLEYKLNEHEERIKKIDLANLR